MELQAAILITGTVVRNHRQQCQRKGLPKCVPLTNTAEKNYHSAENLGMEQNAVSAHYLKKNF